ncbi:MAG: ABC transporter permease, partial [Nitrospirota bacterium]
WFPTGGAVSYNYSALGTWERLLDRIHHLILPVFVLGFIGIGSLIRQMRSNFIEVMRQPYATTARAKGLPEQLVVWKHIFPNAINPLITLLGFEVASLLSGAALTEIVFSWPGLGRLMLEAVTSYDLYLVMGSLFMGTILLIIGNLIADILLAFMDPRIKLG